MTKRDMFTWIDIPTVPVLKISDSADAILNTDTNKVTMLTLENGLGKRIYTYLDTSIGKIYQLDRLMCLAFHGLPPSKDYYVRHIDGNNSNDHPNNLEWVLGDITVWFVPSDRRVVVDRADSLHSKTGLKIEDISVGSYHKHQWYIMEGNVDKCWRDLTDIKSRRICVV